MVQNLSLSKLTSDTQIQKILTCIQAQANIQNARVYVVGGTVRDALLRQPTQDWDLATDGDALSLGRNCAGILDARLVVLDEERLPTVRLIWRSSSQTLDLAQLRAEDIVEDLKQRDLSINAMAVELDPLLNPGYAPLMDPCGGLEDLRARRLRFTAAASALADPLRMLRAYRFAATLGWPPDDSVSTLVSSHHSRLREAAIERIRDEWCKLLDASMTTSVIREMDRVGLLSEILPEMECMKGAEQNAFHHLDVWEHTLLAVDIFERQPIPESLADYRQEIRTYLRTKLVYDKRKRMLIKLALLLHDVAKPLTRSLTPNGRIRFIGHEKLGSEIAKRICDRLRLGGKAKNLVGLLIYNHLRMMHFAKLGEPSPRAIRRFIRHTGEDWLGVLLLSNADLHASQGAARRTEDTDITLNVMRTIADTYYQELEPLVHQPRLITGDDLLRMLPEKPGYWVGQTLRRIEDMQFNGEIRNREEALKAARDYLQELGLGGKQK